MSTRAMLVRLNRQSGVNEKAGMLSNEAHAVNVLGEMALGGVVNHEGQALTRELLRRRYVRREHALQFDVVVIGEAIQPFQLGIVGHHVWKARIGFIHELRSDTRRPCPQTLVSHINGRKLRYDAVARFIAHTFLDHKRSSGTSTVSELCWIMSMTAVPVMKASHGGLSRIADICGRSSG